MPRLVRPRALTSRPRVSVVIPCYNYGRYLPACVDSVLSQASVDVEVIIVDDASPDGSASVAREIAAADDRVTFIAHEVNRGLIATANDGLAAATADIVLLLSADDLLAPGALARGAAVLEAYPAVGLVYGHAPVFTDTPPAHADRVLGWTIWSGSQWLARTSRLGRCVVASPSGMMRTSVLRAAGGYEASLGHTSDFYMWMCAAALSDVAMVNWADQAFWRAHGDNMSLTTFGQRVVDIAERRRTFDHFLSRWGDRVPHARHHHGVATAALGREALRAACQAFDSGLDVGAAELAALAQEISPQLRHGPLWRAYARRARRHESGRWRLPSQVFRAYGAGVRARLGRRLGR